jgi:CBS domain-containing protein
MKARDIMTPNPECVTPDATVQDAARIMRDIDVGFVPVVDDRSSMHLSGVITDRDIAIRCVAEGQDSTTCRVRDHMTSDRLDTCSPDSDVREVMELMQRDQIRRVPVVENDRLIGIVAQADIATESLDESQVSRTLERISEPGEPNR